MYKQISQEYNLVREEMNKLNKGDNLVTDEDLKELINKWNEIKKKKAGTET